MSYGCLTNNNHSSGGEDSDATVAHEFMEELAGGVDVGCSAIPSSPSILATYNVAAAVGSLFLSPTGHQNNQNE